MMNTATMIEQQNVQQQGGGQNVQKDMPVKVVNKGTGAGGANTTKKGKEFEEKTNNTRRLLDMGYTKESYYLSKTFEDKKVVFVMQGDLKKYVKTKYDIEMFRHPDEAYIMEYNSGRKVIKVLEKKEQSTQGSVDTKLWAGASLKREYELVLGPDFEVFYGFCVNDYLKNMVVSDKKKYIVLNKILKESDIPVLYGDDEDYFETLDAWVNSSL
jgi:hypothetical protein